MAKAGNNIYKRKDGRYEGRILMGWNAPQKPRYIYVYARTLREVKQKMDDVRKRNRMNQRGGKNRDLRMQSVAAEWLEAMRKKWKPTTCGMYQSIVYRYILPLLGQYRVTEIGKRLLDEFAASLDERSTRSGLSERYKKYICSITRAIVDYAISVYGLEEKNVSIPDFQVARKAASLPTLQDLERLEEYLMAHLEEDTCLGILVAMNTGIRIGELCALQWKDFDLEKGNLRICRNLQRVRREDGGNGGTDGGGQKQNGQEDAGQKCVRTQVCMQMPKTGSSIRVIPLADSLTDILRAVRKSPDSYLVSGRKRAWSEVRTLQYRFCAILKKCGIEPFHFHLLRHAFASRCVELGCDVKSLSEILGHSSVQITMNIYVHSTTKQKKDIMNLVCELQEKSHSIIQENVLS